MRENFTFRMWSSDAIDLQNVGLVLSHQKMKTIPMFEPNPYTFNKLESGKKMVADPASFTPPSWLLLDHSIAVIWSMFSLNAPVQQLSIDDLKWAYKFLKGVKNRKGENPPDVKVCLMEIQDRLIDLYAKLTSLNEVDFNEIAAAFGDKIMEDTTTNYINTSYIENKIETKVDMLSSSKKSLLQGYPSCKDIPVIKMLKSSSKNGTTSVESDSILYEDASDEEEVEEYVLSLLEEDKKKTLQPKKSAKSLIPTKKKSPPEAVSSHELTEDIAKKEKTSKRVHCVAEMRSLKFKKSTKLVDSNGEEAACSNLKAEIQRLTINPDVMKLIKDCRSEQVKRLHNELKSLSHIEEYMKSLNDEEIQSKLME